LDQKVIVITGAAGFLGSAITVDLSRNHKLTAIDRRQPGRALRRAAPEVVWEQLDIAEAEQVASAFRRVQSEHSRVDFVIHLAAFYHFGTDWLPEYERTNVLGTFNVLQAAKNTGTERLIFASSISAMEPPPPGQMLTEKMPTCDLIPYAKSKMIGEEMIAEGVDRLPGILLRIGGAFSDECELPPLHSLIRMWAGRGPVSRILPGRGESGIPYIHRNDVVQSVRRCIESHPTLDPLEVFLVSQQGAVLHKELFPLIRQTAGKRASLEPILMPPDLARLGLFLRLALGSLTGDVPYERPWMLEFVDRPWVADTSYTQQRLGWSCSPGMGILDRLPMMLQRFTRNRRAWEERNRLRNQRRYVYSP